MANGIQSGNTSLFEEHELVERYDLSWEESDGWKRLPVPWPDDLAQRLARAVQDERAGVTVCLGPPAEPIGSGVLVRDEKGYGILTAGHVCRLFRDKWEKQAGVVLRCIVQCSREPVQPGQKVALPLRSFKVSDTREEYTPGRGVPDYGCLVVSQLDGRNMSAWGTFINLMGDRRTRAARAYRLEHNVWVAAGNMAERAGDAEAFHMHFMGGKRLCTKGKVGVISISRARAVPMQLP